ncbi:MAG: hypothetical protein JJU28_02095 [Cyclobacteriaceae bacterium]|nr:hypothetical protein [Cyclobacteriaceae bacterium]
MKTLIIVVFLASTVIFLFLAYMSVFKKIEIRQKQEGDYVLAGKKFTGPYHKIAPVMDEVDRLLREKGINCVKGAAIFYDNPKETPKEQCRSFAANVIEKDHLSRLQEIKSMGLEVIIIERQNSLVAEFPIRNVLSYMLGPMKIYPAFEKEIRASKAVPQLSYEIYNIPDKKILFVMAVP